VFSSSTTGALKLWRKSSNAAGDPERLSTGPLAQYAQDWSPDGRFILLRRNREEYEQQFDDASA
jgi:Tol biopolymer transport system component